MLSRVVLACLLVAGCGRALGIPEDEAPAGTAAGNDPGTPASDAPSVPPPACATLAHYYDCDARADCYGVYLPAVCECFQAPCPPCDSFDHCEDGPPICSWPTTEPCPKPAIACAPGHVAAFEAAGDCDQICVEQDKC